MAKKLKKFYFIDLFAGFGGVTSGINTSIIDGKKIADVIACVNHDKNAIASHAANHPSALHFIEDIRTLDITPIVKMVNKIRKKDKNAVICLWASLECVNHSNAKGGMSRDADSRTLAWHLFRYIEQIKPDFIWIENVREFMSWCRLIQKEKDGIPQFIAKGKNKGNPVMVPDKRYIGEYYNQWIEDVKSHGYNCEERVLNCADYGSETSRKRLFIQFAKPNFKIEWPEQTHNKLGINGFEKWLPVAPLLDLYDFGESIFTKNKQPVDKSLDRVLRGVKKFYPETFFVKYYGSGNNIADIHSPSPTLTTKDRMYLINSEYGSVHLTGINEPCPAITVNPKQNLVTAQFIKSNYSGGGQWNSIEEPSPTLTTVNKHDVVSSVFLLDHQYGNEGNGIDEPCPTLIARQDKKPKYLVTAPYALYKQKRLNNKLSHSRIKKGDSLKMRELKTYMREKGIQNIYMRPLHIVEMLKIMGLPADYILKGTKTEHKKFIGNAVPRKMVVKLVEKMCYANI